MGRFGLFYGSEWGNTEAASRMIKAELDAVWGHEVCDLHDVKSRSLAPIQSYDWLIFGVSTTDLHDMQHDWRQIVSEASKLDLTGKRLAMFGLGDQREFPDHFADGLGALHRYMSTTGAERIGMGWPMAGYRFNKSRAVVEGSFVGLVLDQDTQADFTAARIAAWVQGVAGQVRGP